MVRAHVDCGTGVVELSAGASVAYRKQWVATTDEELEIPAKAPGRRSLIKITVRDNGIGFNNEFNQTIFRIFQRLHTGNEFEGKGIGLAIVERVMTNHNGYVLASGEPNGGAEFSLYFPVPEG